MRHGGGAWRGLRLAALAGALAVAGAGEDNRLAEAPGGLAGWRPVSGMPSPLIQRLADVNAMRFTFSASSRPQLVGRVLPESPDWKQARGLSFRFKGDGSEGYAALYLLDETFTKQFSVLLSLRSEDWREVTLSWEDFVPERIACGWPGSGPGEWKPGGGSALWVGRGAWHKPWTAFVCELAELRLVLDLERAEPPLPEAPGLPLTLAKLKARQPVTIVALGDSVTQGVFLEGRERLAYPSVLRDLLRQRFGYDGIVVLNRGQGGFETPQGIALLARDLGSPPPDLVLAHFGFNDHTALEERRVAPEARRELARRNWKELVRRVRALTKGRTEVLLLATIPGADAAHRRELEYFGEAARLTAEEMRCAFSDGPRTAFQTVWEVGQPADFFLRQENGAPDAAHLNERGHRLFAEALVEAFSR